MKKYQNLLLIVLAFFAGSIISLSTTLVLAHGGDTNLIHGCVKNSSGSVRIVDANTNCNSNETATDWNAKGLPGTGGFIEDLSHADLSSQDLRYRNFHNANLSNANLGTTNLIFTDFTGANLSSAQLGSAHFSNNDLTTTNISNIAVSQTLFENVNLSNKDLRTITNFYTTTFLGSNLSGTNFSGANLENQVGPSSVPGIFFNASNLSNANFSSVLGDHLEFDNTNLTQTNFTNASLNFANFSQITGSQTNFTNANLQGAAGINNDSLTNPIWSNTTCPDGTNSDNNGNTCVGHLTP